MPYPKPGTTCLRCGITNREARAERATTGAMLGCVTSHEDGDREWDSHVWTPKPVTPTENIVNYVEDALQVGQSTTEILERWGIQYDSLVKRLRGTEVKERFQAARRAEAYERRYGFRF